MKPQFSASLMCMEFLNIQRDLDILNRECDLYHVDIMDGHFVKNVTLSPLFLKKIRPALKLPVDVHLMVTDPDSYIEDCAEAGADCISVHAEVIANGAFRIFDKIRRMGCKTGLVVNAATPLSAASEYLDRIDLLTIMGFDAGYAGQRFVPSTLGKMRRARELREEKSLNYLIQVDGACCKENYKSMHEAGCEIFIGGVLGLFFDGVELGRACGIMKAEFEEETGIKVLQ